MQQFTVPQFIDVEDKIFGPITARQFVIMLAGFLLIAICYKVFAFTMFIILGLLIFGISGLFAFLKINGMPFQFFVLNFTQTLRRPALRVWNSLYKKYSVIEKKERVKAVEIIPPRKSYTSSRLTELSLIVDTRGVYRGDDDKSVDRIKTNVNLADDTKKIQSSL